MPKTWSEVAASPAFKALPPEDQDGARKQYFDDVVAPKVPPEQHDIAFEQFSVDSGMGRRELPAGVAPSSAGGGRGSVNPGAAPATVVSAQPAAEPLGDPSGSGDAAAIMAVAQPARTSVLEGRTMPEPAFDAGEAARLSNRAYAETTPQPGTARPAQSVRASGPRVAPSKATERGEALVDAAPPIRALFKGVSGVAQGAGGALRAIGDATGSDTLSAAGKSTAQGAEEFEQGMGTQGPVLGFGPKSPVPYLTNQAEGAASSLGQSAYYASLLGPRAVIPLMSVMTAGQEYDKARNAGMDPAAALAGAIPKGAFEAIGEKFTGLDKVAGAMGTLLTKGASAEAKKGAAEVLIKSGIKEVPGEVVTYLGQTGVDLLPGIGLNPDLTMGQFVDGLRDTVVQSAMMGGAMAGGGHAAQADPRIKRLRDAGETGAADLLQQKLDKANTAASVDSELTNIAPLADFAQTPEFQADYRLMRTEGVKPVEAAGRSALTSTFRGLASASGMSEKAVNAAMDAAKKVGLDKLPGFLQKYTASLAAKGLIQPVDGMDALGASLEQTRDHAMNAAIGATLPPEDVRSTMDDVQALEAGQAAPALENPAAQAQPAELPASAELDLAAHDAATSPLNNLPEPTDAQKKAGNYKVGRVNLHGLNISIENPEGSTRRGVDPETGKPWENTLAAHYGYIRGTEGNDGDHVDTFIGPNPDSDKVFVIDQVNKDGTFDEHKVMLGADSLEQADELYHANYAPGWTGRGAITEMPLADFKAWVRDGVKTQPLGSQVQAAQQQQAKATAPDVQNAPVRPPVTTETTSQTPAAQTGAPAGGEAAGTAAAGSEAGAAPLETPRVVLGRNNVPLADGGKAFKTRQAADEARKLNPAMRVIRAEGGFALTEKTPAQLAAQEKAARRLRNPQTSPAGQPIPAHAMIASAGGLAGAERADMGMEGNVTIGNRKLFAGAGKGLTIERATEKLIEEGYLPQGAGHDQARALIKRSLTQPQYTAEGFERMAEAETQARFDAAMTPEEAIDEAVAQIEALSDNQFDALLDAEIPWDAPSNTSPEAAMKALGFTDQEIQDATANQPGEPQDDRSGRGEPDEGSTSEAQADPGRRAQAAQPAEEVTQTPADAGVSTSAPEFESKLRDDGTLAITGDAKAIREALSTIPAKSLMAMRGGILVGRTQADKAAAILRGETPKLSAREAAEAGQAAREAEKKAQQAVARAKPAPGGLSVGMMPSNAEPITVKDGVVFIGKNEAINFDSGEPVTVPAGATDQQIVDALKDAGALSRRQRVFGLAKDGEGLTAPTKEDVLAGIRDSLRAMATDAESAGDVGLQVGTKLKYVPFEAAVDAARAAAAAGVKVVPFQIHNETHIRLGDTDRVIAAIGLTAPTQADVLAQQQRKEEGEKADAKATTAAENKAKADAARGEFTLTGSDRPADVGAAGGQKGMFARGVWRSELANQIKGTQMNTSQAAGWKSYIDGLTKKGVKPDEIEWSGVREWLDLQTGKVSKAEVLNYLTGNGVKVEETMLGGGRPEGEAERLAELQAMSLKDLRDEAEDFGLYMETGNRADIIDAIMAEQSSGEEDNSANRTTYGNYQLPGGRNYRELMLTLPTRGASLPEPELRQNERGMWAWFGGDVQLTGAFTNRAIAEAAKAQAERPSLTDANNYKSSHWDQKNILAHIRFNERTDADGKKVLFIEEIQSDWAQEGKKKGFNKTPAEKARHDQLRQKWLDNTLTEDEGKEFDGLGDQYKNTGVPNAPFVGKTDAWVALAVKRMVSYAAENGFDRVAFVNGKQSADRYDLSKQVDAIRYAKNGDGNYDVEVDVSSGGVRQEYDLPISKVEELVGKEIAKKMEANDGADDKAIDSGIPMKMLTGLDLKVGGEGMKAFYDKIVPTVAKDVLRKLGGGSLTTVPLKRPIDDYGRTARWKGPNRTMDQVRELYDLSQKSGRGIHDNPITGNREVFVINRVAVEGDLRRMVKSMEGGKSFAEAIIDPDVSGSVAELFGGEIERFDGGSEPMPQPGFDITPAMREHAAAGMPMFARKGFDADAFSRMFRPPTAMPITDVQKAVDQLSKGWKSGPTIKVVATPADLPIDAPADARGFIHDGTAYIVAGNHLNRDGVARTLGHEAVGHYGLWRILGDEGQKRYERNLQLALKSGNVPLGKIAAKVRDAYVDSKGKFNLSPTEEANEIAAFAVEAAIDPATGEFKPGFGFVKEVFAKVAEFLRSLGIDVKFTNAELQGMLMAAMRSLKAGHRLEGGGQVMVAAARDGTGANPETVGQQSTDPDTGLPQFAGRDGLFIGFAAPTERLEFIPTDDNQQMLNFVIMRDGQMIGSADLLFEGGKLKSLYDIEVDKAGRGKGDGAAVIRTLLASDPSRDVEISNIVETARNFWESVGVPQQNLGPGEAYDGNLNWQIFTDSRAGRRAAQGNDGAGAGPVPGADAGAAGPGQKGDGQAAFARGTGNLFQPNIWTTPEPTRTDRVIYELQDGKVDLKRVQEAIKKSGQQITEQYDARLAETLYPGRVAYRSKTFLDVEAKPLLEAMARNNVPMDELADYLHARGAEERNAQIAKVNPNMPDGGAGTNTKGVLMTDQAARDYLDNVRPARRVVLDAMAKRVDAITAGTRQLLVAEGLEKQETIDAWEGAYKNYVPMFRDEAETAMPPHPQGSGFAVKGNASRRATGSTKEVTNILAHVLMQREAAITRAEKNRVALALYGQALSHPNPDFWTTIRPGMKAAEIAAELQAMGVDPMTAEVGMEGVPTIRTVDPITNKVVDRPNPIYKNLPGAIPLKVNGADRVLMLNVENERGRRLAESLKNLDGLTQLDLAGSIIGKATRWLAAVNTQYNPAFGLVNLSRDVLEGAINIGSTDLRGNSTRVLAQVPLAVQGIARELAAEGKGGSWGTLYKQFVADGGQTGFKENFRDPNERARAVEKELERLHSAGKLTPGNAAHAALDLLDGFNTTLENAVRLSAYKVGLENGMSRAAAARLARELTVDFNRKGRAGREVGPLYAFFNASVQGAERALRTLRGPTGGRIIAGGLALGVLQALMLAAAGYDDDEVPEFVKTRAFVIPLNWSGKGEKKHILIPLPLGFLMVPNTGRVLTELTLNGGKDMGKRIVEAVGTIAGSFNPLGGGNIFTPDGALRTLAPTLVDPLIELGFNKNFAGSPIEKQAYGSETDGRPGAARVKESTQRSTTGQAYIGISKAINTLAGGTPYQAGVVSPTPERVRYIAQTVGGGVLREIEKTINASTAAAAGGKVKSSQIPVLGRFYGEVDDDQVAMTRYYEGSKKLKTLESSLNAAKKAGDGAAMLKMLEEHPEAAFIKAQSRVQSEISKLNKQAVGIVDNPEVMKVIDSARVEKMKALTDAIEEMERARGKKTLGDRIKATRQPEVATVPP
ncbi:Inorganic Pyrophosphatase [compost metagenome]